MKIIILIFFTILFISCGNNKEEQMLYDYQQKIVRAGNFDLKDLDFKIQKIEKIANIKASDSLKSLKFQLADSWRENPEQSFVDTLSFGYVKNALQDAIHDSFESISTLQKKTLTAIKLKDYSYQEHSGVMRLKALDDIKFYTENLDKVRVLEEYYKGLAKNPDSVLSTKYNAIYSMHSPMLNVRQTFDRVYYTNAAQTKFVKEEKNPDEI